MQFTLPADRRPVCYYSDRGCRARAKGPIYPEFVWQTCRPVSRPVIAAILGGDGQPERRSTLASTVVVDFYRARAKSVECAAALKLARWATVVWGLVLLDRDRGAAFRARGGTDHHSIQARCWVFSCSAC